MNDLGKSMIRYEVEITGHAPPFKWIVYRVGLDGIEYKIDAGEADAMAEAISQAEEASRRDQEERRHRNTKVRCLLFECEPEAGELERYKRDATVVNFGLAGQQYRDKEAA